MTDHPLQDRAAYARSVLMRKTDDRWAERLRSHGFLVLAPEEIPVARDMIAQAARGETADATPAGGTE